MDVAVSLENRLRVMRAATSEMSPAQREVFHDYMLGYVSVYITPEKWDECVQASVDVALKVHGRKPVERNAELVHAHFNSFNDLGGEKTAEGGREDPRTPPTTAATNISGKDAAAGPDA